MHYQTLDDAITLHLRKSGKTQAQLAEEMGMAENTFSWKRRGVREWSLTEAIQLSRIVGLESLNGVLGEHEAS